MYFSTVPEEIVLFFFSNQPKNVFLILSLLSQVSFLSLHLGMTLGRFPLKRKKCGQFSVQGGFVFSCGEPLQGRGAPRLFHMPWIAQPRVPWVMLEEHFWDLGVTSQPLEGKRESSGDPQQWHRENTPKLAGLEVKKS